MQLDIGQRIKTIVDQQHWNYSDFARAINCSRSSVYHIFNNQDISLGRLIQIGRILGHDFISEIARESSAVTQASTTILVLPIRDRHLDLSQLPDEIIKFIKSEI